MTGQVVRFATFSEFVTTPPLKGLGVSLELIDRIASVDPELMTLVAKAKVQDTWNRTPRTETPIDDNVIDRKRTSPDGNSAQQACLRLSRQAPEIHARVLSGEISPHAGMIQAGFRRKTITIPLDPQDAARCICRHFAGESLDTLLSEIAAIVADHQA